MSAGSRAAQERINLGLTQEQVARAVSRLGYQISQTGIDKMEKRDTTRPRFAKELAEALGVTEDWLLTGRGPKHQESHVEIDGLLREARTLPPEDQALIFAQFRALLDVAMKRNKSIRR